MEDGGGAGHVVVLAQPAQPGFEAAGARLALFAGRAGRAGTRAAGRPLQLLPGPILVVWVLLHQAANSTVQTDTAQLILRVGRLSKQSLIPLRWRV